MASRNGAAHPYFDNATLKIKSTKDASTRASNFLLKNSQKLQGDFNNSFNLGSDGGDIKVVHHNFLLEEKISCDYSIHSVSACPK